jgi:hypothetical protein
MNSSATEHEFTRRSAMRTMVKGFVVGTLGLAVLFGSSGVSLAAIKDPTGFKCLCVCKVATGPGSYSYTDLISDETAYGCQANVGATCNVRDPATGGTSSGSIFICDQIKPGTEGTYQLPPRTSIPSRGVKPSPAAPGLKQP